MSADKKKCIEVTIIKVKPKYMSQFIAGIPAGKALYEKHGAKVLAYSTPKLDLDLK